MGIEAWGVRNFAQTSRVPQFFGDTSTLWRGVAFRYPPQRNAVIGLADAMELRVKGLDRVRRTR